MNAPTVYVTIDYGTEQRSAVAYDEAGEIVETVEWRDDGTPSWQAAGICDHRGMGGQEGYVALIEALNAAELNAQLGGLDVRRVSRPRTFAPGEHVQAKLDAVEPMQLMKEPTSVFLRHDNSGGFPAAVTVIGSYENVQHFIMDQWGFSADEILDTIEPLDLGQLTDERSDG